MKVVQINQVSGMGSTGRIVEQLSDTMAESGIQNAVLYGYGHTEHPAAHKFGSARQELFHKVHTKMTGHHAFASGQATREMLRFMDAFQPDLVHLHNLHGYYLNAELLFGWLKEKKLPVVWTLHDCWPFTGHCAHFDYIGCQKWKTGCGNCPDKKTYPGTFRDASAENWQRKKAAFTGLRSGTIVTPSRWLKQLVEASFLAEYPVKCIPNGISLEEFKPTPGCNVREKRGKRIVLASAASLHGRKGGQYLPGLAARLGGDYEVWVLGLKQETELPDNLIPLPYLHSTQELASVYTAADVFVNPTLEDNFPTVNLEALACGTPVVTFRTGGSPESVTAQCGAVVEQGDEAALAEAVKYWSDHADRAVCVRSAGEYEAQKQFLKYVALYRAVLAAE